MMDNFASRDIQLATEAARRIGNIGGTAFFVGGYVRDALRGVESGTLSDIDVEVFGISPRDLKNVLSEFGVVNEYGMSYGVITVDGFHVEFAVARTERKTGATHQSFEMTFDKMITPEIACRRRDFTINALMRNVMTGELLDYVGGVRDIERGVIRHVNDATFVEDPLRVFRAARFAAQLDYRVDGATIELCKSMDTATLPRERVSGETMRAIYGSKPSRYFETLRCMNKLDCVRVRSYSDSLRVIDDAPPHARLAALCSVIDSPAHFLDGLVTNKLDKRVALSVAEVAARIGEYPSYDVNTLILLYDECESPDLLRTTLNLLCNNNINELIINESIINESIINESIINESIINESFRLYNERASLRMPNGDDILAAGILDVKRIGAIKAHARRLILLGASFDEAMGVALDVRRALPS